MNDHLHPLFRGILNAVMTPQRPPNRNWWCNYCECEVPPEHVTYEERHDPRYGGCDSRMVWEIPSGAKEDQRG